MSKAKRKEYWDKEQKQKTIEGYLSEDAVIGIETKDKDMKLLKYFPLNKDDFNITYPTGQSIGVAPDRLMEAINFLQYAHDQGKYVEVTVQKDKPLRLRVIGSDTSWYLAPIEGSAVKEADNE